MTVTQRFARALGLAFWGLVFFPILASAQAEKEPDLRQPTPKQVEPAIPPSTPIPGPNAVQESFDLPRDKMNEALKDLYSDHTKEAGKKIKEVIVAMQTASDTSRGEAIKANLLRSVVELEPKAERLRSGGSVSSDEMSPIFSRALQALAEHHAALADLHLQSGDRGGAGQDLRASVLDVNQAVMWGNVKLSAEETNRLSAAARAAKSLIEQKPVDKAGTAKIVSDMEDWVRGLRGRLPKSGA